MLNALERETSEPDVSALYGAEYYASHCGPVPYARTDHWLGFFGSVADVLVRSFAPRRVFDAGCAIGLLVESFWDRGVEAHGRDVSEWAIEQIRADVRFWCEVGSIADPIDAEFDLVTCIEVLEHMPEAEAVRAVEVLAAAAPRILFSSSPTDLVEPTHVNVRPPIYWLNLWARAGFAPSVTHDAGYLAPHAYVLERSESGRSERELVAFADRVRNRVALAQVGDAMHAARAQAAEAQRATAQREADAEVARETAKAAVERERLAASRAEAAESALGAVKADVQALRGQLSASQAELAALQHSTAVDGAAAQAALSESQADGAARESRQRGRADRAEQALRFTTAAAESAQASLATRTTELAEARHVASAAHAAAAAASSELSLLRGEHQLACGARDHALARAEAAEADAASIRARIEGARRDTSIARANYKAVLTSTTWIATTPVRLVAGLLPRPFRRRVRQAMFLAGWAATFQISARLRGRRLMLARARRVEASEQFDPRWYSAVYPDVAGSGLSPAVHYAARGGPEGRDPGPAFHTPNYLERHPEAADEPGGAFMHALARGTVVDGATPVPRFQPPPLPPAAPASRAVPEPVPAAPEPLVAKPAIVTPEPSPPTAGALLAARFPDLTALPVFAAPHAGQRRLTIVTDSINSGSLYGGVGTALIIGALAARRLGAGLRLVTRIEPPEVSNVGLVLGVHGIPWDGNVEFVHAPRGDALGGKDVPASQDDLFLTTSWWTTWSTRQSVPRARIAYLLQEDERMFYPLGDDHLRCTETLSDPGVLYLVNSELLLSHFKEAGLAPGGVAFEPSFPSQVYHSSEQERRPARGKRGFFFYARPHNPRNLYWRGVEALSAAIEEGVLDPAEWDFHFAGHGAGPMSLPRGATALFPGPMAWTEYAAMARRMEVGLCLMYTPHPSYPPLDLAASGAVVVTNRFGPKSELSRYSPNILCADPDVPSLVAALRQATALAADSEVRAANFSRSGLQRDWAVSVAPALDRLVAWAKA